MLSFSPSSIVRNRVPGAFTLRASPTTTALLLTFATALNAQSIAFSGNQTILANSSKVQTLTKAGIEQNITRLHPEYGAHVVYGPKGEVLTAQNKPAGKLYVQIDLFNEDNFKPRLPLANITDGIPEPFGPEIAKVPFRKSMSSSRIPRTSSM
jgi:hypothetical protein